MTERNLLDSTEVSVDAAFLADFATMSEFGATLRGGVDRQAATEADNAQRLWFAQLLSAHGLQVEYDAIGNQFGLLTLAEGAPYVLIGSHMDSQPTAGRFDGAYGVMAAAHAAFRLVERWRDRDEAPKYNLAVVNWFNEEGSRFKPSMMGSSVYTGKLPLADALAITDRAGISVESALRPTGFLGSGSGPIAAFCAEIHIEQGRILENTGTTIGLVEATWAAHKYEIVVNGEQAHSGATVMRDRRDALVAASSLVVDAHRIAVDSDGRLHSSVGQLEVYPNSPVVVASRVTLLMDFRSPEASLLAAAESAIYARIREIEKETGVTIAIRRSHAWDVNPYHPEGVRLAEASAKRLGLTHAAIMTVAGHDSTNMKDIVPTVMLFVPSVNGVSHNELEFTNEKDMLAGVALFTDVVESLAQGELE